MKRYAIEVTQSAYEDLLRIEEYVTSQDSLTAAAAIATSILDRIDELARFPMRGVVVPEFTRFALKQYRQVLQSGYRIIYRVDGSTVGIVLVIHERRDLRNIALEHALRPGKRR